MTIKLDPTEITEAARRAFNDDVGIKPTLRAGSQLHTAMASVVHALCEALEAATASVQTLPRFVTSPDGLRPVDAVPWGEPANVAAQGCIQHDLRGAKLDTRGAVLSPEAAQGTYHAGVARAVEARALDAMRLREPGAEHVGVIRSGRMSAEDSYSADRSDVDASPELVAELIRKAKAGEGRRTVAAVVHHYEVIIARALAELMGIDHSACEAAADILRGER
jgi:hypothetical protein